MTHLRDADFQMLGNQLAEELGVRRVWVQYSNNASRVRVCITVFFESGYRMFFGDHIKNFSYDAIRSLVS